MEKEAFAQENAEWMFRAEQERHYPILVVMKELDELSKKFRHETRSALGRAGRKDLYQSRPDFNTEVYRRLDDIGIFDSIVDPAWIQSKLEKQMSVWCQKNWGKEPAISTVRKRITLAVAEYTRGVRVSNRLLSAYCRPIVGLLSAISADSRNIMDR